MAELVVFKQYCKTKENCEVCDYSYQHTGVCSIRDVIINVLNDAAPDEWDLRKINALARKIKNRNKTK